MADRRRLDTVDGDGELGQMADVGVEQAVRPVGAELAVVTRQHARRGADAGDQLVEERLRHGLQSSRTEVYRSNAVARGFERSTHPTLTSVSRGGGVSRQTVSNILNAPHKVHRETRARVQAEIARQGYRPNRSARSLRTSRSHCLGYCVPAPTAFGNPVMDRFLHAISEAAERRGYHVLLFTQAADGAGPRSAYEALLGQRAIDGFVLSDTTVGDDRQPWLRQLDVPFAAFGRRFADGEVGPWVDVDGAAGAAAAVRHLSALGHRRIAFIGWPEGSGVGDDRYRGCVEAAAGSEVDIVAIERTDNSIERRSGGGHAAARRGRTRQRHWSASATCSRWDAMPPSVRPAGCPVATSPSPASTTHPPPVSPPCR